MRENKGITLIALIITIIVLLILAGVSISLVVGENGIIGRAQSASEKTKLGDRSERANLEKMTELIDETVSGVKNVEQVKDKNPGKLEENGSEKIINSIEDLVYFANSVTNGTTYEGETIKLGLSLDFNSSKSYVDPYRTDYGKYGYNGELKTLLTSGEGFKPIGVTTNENGYVNKSFKGIFNGNEKIIKNLYINKKVEDNVNDLILGLFGINFGEIENLGLENCNINGELTSNGVNSIIVGGIVSRSYGKINSCFVSGKILSKANKTAKSFAGGIASSANFIKNCYNLAIVTGIASDSSNVIGGISGRWCAK